MRQRFSTNKDWSIGKEVSSQFSVLMYLSGRRIRSIVATRVKLWAGVMMVSILLFLVPVIVWNGPFWFDASLISAISDQEKRLVAVNADRSVLLQITLAVAGGITVIFTTRTFLLSKAGQVTDRFTKATTQLASEKVAERIGGIHALSRLLKDSSDDHSAVIDVLVSFIKQVAIRPMAKGEVRVFEEEDSSQFSMWHEIETHPEIDVQAALKVILRRPKRYESPWISFGNTDLRGAAFTGGWVDTLHFKGSDLRGTDFASARARIIVLIDCDLRGANLSGATLLTARLSGSDLRCAYLRWTDFRGAHMSGADLRETLCFMTRFHGATMTDVNLEGVDLSSALGLTGEQIQDAITDDQTLLPGYLK